MADIILDRQRDYPADVIAKEQIIFFSRPFSVVFNFLLQEQISVLNIVPPPWYENGITTQIIALTLLSD